MASQPTPPASLLGTGASLSSKYSSKPPVAGAPFALPTFGGAARPPPAPTPSWAGLGGAARVSPSLGVAPSFTPMRREGLGFTSANFTLASSTTPAPASPALLPLAAPAVPPLSVVPLPGLGAPAVPITLPVLSTIPPASVVSVKPAGEPATARFSSLMSSSQVVKAAPPALVAASVAEAVEDSVRSLPPLMQVQAVAAGTLDAGYLDQTGPALTRRDSNEKRDREQAAGVQRLQMLWDAPQLPKDPSPHLQKEAVRPSSAQKEVPLASQPQPQPQPALTRKETMTLTSLLGPEWADTPEEGAGASATAAGRDGDVLPKDGRPSKADAPASSSSPSTAAILASAAAVAVRPRMESRAPSVFTFPGVTEESIPLPSWVSGPDVSQDETEIKALLALPSGMLDGSPLVATQLRLLLEKRNLRLELERLQGQVAVDQVKEKMERERIRREDALTHEGWLAAQKRLVQEAKIRAAVARELGPDVSKEYLQLASAAPRAVPADPVARSESPASDVSNGLGGSSSVVSELVDNALQGTRPRALASDSDPSSPPNSQSVERTKSGVGFGPRKPNTLKVLAVESNDAARRKAEGLRSIEVPMATPTSATSANSPQSVTASPTAPAADSVSRNFTPRMRSLPSSPQSTATRIAASDLPRQPLPHHNLVPSSVLNTPAMRLYNPLHGLHILFDFLLGVTVRATRVQVAYCFYVGEEMVGGVQSIAPLQTESDGGSALALAKFMRATVAAHRVIDGDAAEDILLVIELQRLADTEARAIGWTAVPLFRLLNSGSADEAYSVFGQALAVPLYKPPIVLQAPGVLANLAKQSAGPSTLYLRILTHAQFTAVLSAARSRLGLPRISADKDALLEPPTLEVDGAKDVEAWGIATASDFASFRQYVPPLSLLNGPEEAESSPPPMSDSSRPSTTAKSIATSNAVSPKSEEANPTATINVVSVLFDSTSHTHPAFRSPRGAGPARARSVTLRAGLVGTPSVLPSISLGPSVGVGPPSSTLRPFSWGVEGGPSSKLCSLQVPLADVGGGKGLQSLDLEALETPALVLEAEAVAPGPEFVLSASLTLLDIVNALYSLLQQRRAEVGSKGGLTLESVSSLLMGTPPVSPVSAGEEGEAGVSSPGGTACTPHLGLILPLIFDLTGGDGAAALPDPCVATVTLSLAATPQTLLRMLQVVEAEEGATPSPPPPPWLELTQAAKPVVFDPVNDVLELVLDGARFLPDNITVSKATIKVLSSGFEPLCGGGVETPASLGSDILSPRYNSCVRLVPPGLSNTRGMSTLLAKRGMARDGSAPDPSNLVLTAPLPPSATLLVRIDTLESHTNSLAAAGYAVLNLFCVEGGGTMDQPGLVLGEDGLPKPFAPGRKLALNVGAFQLPLYQVPPSKSSPLNTMSLSKTPRVPCATVILRLRVVPRGGAGESPYSAPSLADAPPPAYNDHVYDSTRCRPLPAELLLYPKRADIAAPTIATVLDDFYSDAEQALGEAPPPTAGCAVPPNGYPGLSRYALARLPENVKRFGIPPPPDATPAARTSWLLARLTGTPPAMLDYGYLSPYDPIAGLKVRVDSVVSCPTRLPLATTPGSPNTPPALLLKVVYSPLPLAALLVTPRDRSTSHFTQQHDWDASSPTVQRFKDTYTSVAGLPFHPSTVVLFEVMAVTARCRSPASSS